MGLKDEHALAIIKQNLGGSIKLRSGVKALRYRLHNKLGMLELINRINGNIRHTSRIKQLEKVAPFNANQPGLAFELGLLYYRANQKDKAFEQLQRAIVLYPASWRR